MDRIEKTINDLTNYEISKYEAIDTLREIFDDGRKKGAIEFEVVETATTVGENDGIIRAIARYRGSQMEKVIKKGTKIDVTPVY